MVSHLYFIVFSGVVFNFFNTLLSEEISQLVGKSPKSKSHNSRQSLAELEPHGHSKFGSEEFGGGTLQARRLDRYQVIHVDGTLLNPSAYSKSKQIRSIQSDHRDEKKDGHKKSSTKSKNAYFNAGIDDCADASDVDDECPKMRPCVTEKNARFEDTISSKNYRLFPQLPYGAGECEVEKYADTSDILSYQVKPCNMYTSHNPEFDGRSSISKKEERIHLRRCPNIHPDATYNRNNELDPRVPYYVDDRDIGTSQKDMESHIGRKYGRDKKPKMFQNSNSFESKNENCIIS